MTAPMPPALPAAAAAEQQLRELLEASAEAALILASDGMVSAANARAHGLFGYAPGELVGCHVDMLLPKVRGRQEPGEDSPEDTGPRKTSAGFGIRKNGSKFRAELTIRALDPPCGATVVVVVHERLQEGQALAQELEQSREQLQLRSELADLTYCEFRTPLTALQLLLPSLKQRLGAARAPALDRELERAFRQVQRLTALLDKATAVNEVLSRGVSLRRAWFDFASLVTQSVRDSLPEAERQACAIRLTAPAEVTLDGDERRLGQVVSDVLLNALRFGAGKPVEVTLEADRDAARLTITDAGPGIDPTRMAELFAHVSPARRTFGTLGVSLWLAHKVVLAHGGTLVIDNVPGAGARVQIKIPIGSPPSGSAL